VFGSSASYKGRTPNNYDVNCMCLFAYVRVCVMNGKWDGVQVKDKYVLYRTCISPSCVVVLVFVVFEGVWRCRVRFLGKVFKKLAGPIHTHIR